MANFSKTVVQTLANPTYDGFKKCVTNFRNIAIKEVTLYNKMVIRFEWIYNESPDIQVYIYFPSYCRYIILYFSQKYQYASTPLHSSFPSQGPMVPVSGLKFSFAIFVL